MTSKGTKYFPVTQSINLQNFLNALAIVCFGHHSARIKLKQGQVMRGISFQFSNMLSIILLCVSVNQSPGWALRLNYEVVEFQASVRDSYILRPYCLSLTNFTQPLPPHLSQPFLDLSIFPPPANAPPVTAVHRRNNYLYICSPPTLPAWSVVHLAVALTCHPLAFDARLCTLRRVPTSATISCVRLPSLCRPCPVPSSQLSPRGFACRGSLRLRASPLLPPYVFPCLPESSIAWFLLGGSCRAGARGQGTSTPWQSLALVLTPSLIGHAGAVQDTPPHL